MFGSIVGLFGGSDPILEEIKAKLDALIRQIDENHRQLMNAVNNIKTEVWKVHVVN